LFPRLQKHPNGGGDRQISEPSTVFLGCFYGKSSIAKTPWKLKNTSPPENRQFDPKGSWIESSPVPTIHFWRCLFNFGGLVGSTRRSYTSDHTRTSLKEKVLGIRVVCCLLAGDSAADSYQTQQLEFSQGDIVVNAMDLFEDLGWGFFEEKIPWQARLVRDGG